MKAQILAAALLLGTSGFALAADPGVPMEEPPIGFNWTGGYIGGQIGYENFPVDITNFGGAIWRASPDTDAFAGGVFAGYRYQFDNGFVVGAEADAGWISGDDTAPFDLAPQFGVKFDPNWDASIRATVGFATGRFLPYVTGGVAFLDYDFEPDQPQTDTSYGDTVTGWTVGVGAAYAFTDNIIGQVDYRYSDFGTESFDTSGIIGSSTDVDVQMHKLMLGVAYKF